MGDYMLYTISDFKNKQAVSVDNGMVLGFIGDLEIDCENGTVSNLVIYGRSRLMGALGREEDLKIPWSNIEVIGDETVLVKGAYAFKSTKRKSF